MNKSFFILLLPFLLFAAPLKIMSLKQEGNAIQINFNKQIKQSDFKKYIIKAGVYYDVKAEFPLVKKTFKIDNHFITIAQNNKTISRIVIESKTPQDSYFKINKNVLRIGFEGINNKNKVIEDKEKVSSIVNLFNSIDSKDKPQIQNPKSTKDDNNSTTTKAQTNTKDSAKYTKSRIIVLDPGHGGKDCGAQVNKICEKAITLSIGKKAKKILQSRGYNVYMTRVGDKYINLTDRTKFANQKEADVFVSIHANALDKKSKNYAHTSGIETYFLSVARSERARKVAELENKDDIEVMNYFSKLSFLNSINSQRLLASNKLAIDVQIGMLMNAREMYKTIDGGVREGPFWVLAGALMPSILVEIGYMTNKDDLARLQIKEYQNTIANGIADGIESYFTKNL